MVESKSVQQLTFLEMEVGRQGLWRTSIEEIPVDATGYFVVEFTAGDSIRTDPTQIVEFGYERQAAEDMNQWVGSAQKGVWRGNDPSPMAIAIPLDFGQGVELKGGRIMGYISTRFKSESALDVRIQPDLPGGGPARTGG